MKQLRKGLEMAFKLTINYNQLKSNLSGKITTDIASAIFFFSSKIESGWKYT